MGYGRLLFHKRPALFIHYRVTVSETSSIFYRIYLILNHIDIHLQVTTYKTTLVRHVSVAVNERNTYQPEQ